MNWQLISHAFLKSDTPKNFWTIPSVHFKLDSKLNLKKMLSSRFWLLRYGLPTRCIAYILWSQTIHWWRTSQHILSLAKTQESIKYLVEILKENLHRHTRRNHTLSPKFIQVFVVLLPLLAAVFCKLFTLYFTL